MKLTSSQARKFQETVWDYYRTHGRSFPWREPTDPYHILVSEIMLQQTQADRVVGYYERFMDRFPDVRSLARGRLSTVLRLWQGLGYNRRAKLLHECARQVAKHLDGQLPTEESELVKLPGIGPYTASAIAAFAGNRPTVVLETNIRSVYIHHFFGNREGITDKELIPLIERTIDTENPRDWYQALMDYGAMLKRKGINPSRRSAHYVRQSTFKGSNREARGAVLRVLSQGPVPEPTLPDQAALAPDRAKQALEQLVGEGFVRRQRGVLKLA